jgi:hypothetical protein
MKSLRLILENEDNNIQGVSPTQFKKDLKSKSLPNYDWVHENAQRNLTGNISHIKGEEKHAIGRWTQPSPVGYKEINGHMRNGNGDEETDEISNHLHNAVNGHELPNATYAYRGIHANHSRSLNSLRPGDTFHSRGFSSTTLDPARATHFAKGEDIMAFHIPQGSKALYVSHPKLNSWTPEREMLLPNNTHFKYHGHETIEAPEHDYTGRKTGKTRKYKLHHVEVIPHSRTSIQIDK